MGYEEVNIEKQKEEALRVWNENPLTQVLFSNFDEYWQEVRKDTIAWNNMTESQRQRLTDEFLKTIDESIKKLKGIIGEDDEKVDK